MIKALQHQRHPKEADEEQSVPNNTPAHKPHQCVHYWKSRLPKTCWKQYRQREDTRPLPRAALTIKKCPRSPLRWLSPGHFRYSEVTRYALPYYLPRRNPSISAQPPLACSNKYRLTTTDWPSGVGLWFLHGAIFTSTECGRWVCHLSNSSV